MTVKNVRTARLRLYPPHRPTYGVQDRRTWRLRGQRGTGRTVETGTEGLRAAVQIKAPPLGVKGAVAATAAAMVAAVTAGVAVPGMFTASLLGEGE